MILAKIRRIRPIFGSYLALVGSKEKIHVLDAYQMVFVVYLMCIDGGEW